MKIIEIMCHVDYIHVSLDKQYGYHVYHLNTCAPSGNPQLYASHALTNQMHSYYKACLRRWNQYTTLIKLSINQGGSSRKVFHLSRLK